jgi:hypothetical protein
MWIFLDDAFLSVVAHTERPDDLLVRARVSGDIERAFPGVDVLTTPDADYRYRAVVPRAEVGRVLARRAESVDYPNFKSSIDADERERSAACHQVWSVMRRLQPV